MFGNSQLPKCEGGRSQNNLHTTTYNKLSVPDTLIMAVPTNWGKLLFGSSHDSATSLHLPWAGLLQKGTPSNQESPWQEVLRVAASLDPLLKISELPMQTRPYFARVRATFSSLPLAPISSVRGLLILEPAFETAGRRYKALKRNPLKWKSEPRVLRRALQKTFQTLGGSQK